MKFLADESMEYRVVEWLRSAGFDVLAIADNLASIKDEKVLTLANIYDRILLTNDKDFGELVFRLGMVHKGVVLFRLPNDNWASKTLKLKELIKRFDKEIEGKFIVITHRRVRISRAG